MNEPRRWLDEPMSVSPEIRRLLEAARPPTPMTQREVSRSVEDIERIESRAMIPLRAPFGLRAGSFAIAAAILMLGALAAAGIPALVRYWVLHNSIVDAPAIEEVGARQPSAPGAQELPKVAALASAPSAPDHSTTKPLGVHEKSPAPTVAAAPPPTASAIKSADAVEPSSADHEAVEEEVELLDRARAARDSDPARALVLLGEHAQRFPNGRLGFDRELLTIDALRSAGRLAEARARALMLLERAKGRPHEEKMRRLVESLQ